MPKTNKNEAVEQIKSDYLNTFQIWLGNMGIDPYIGRIMQTLRFADHPITQSEIQELIGLSKPTISRNLKVMEEINLLKIDLLSSADKGNDRYAYALKENSLYYLFSKYLTNAYNLLNRRLDDHKIFMRKIDQLPEKLIEDKDIQKLSKFIKEEDEFFRLMISKFEYL
ncbi:MAG: winged helix-turn-helix transcriptional regulator, partial [Candidatus Thorarchaeota archaeon]